MAITIASEILGQEVSSTVSYCYMYEPLRINLYEDNLLAVKFYIDVELSSIETGVVVDTLIKYAEFDINAGHSFSFDAMELVQQVHDANVFKIATIDDLLSSPKDAIISKYIFRFIIYTDKTETPVSVRKIPIIGGRTFREFVPSVTFNQPLTEFNLFGIDERELILSRDWGGYTFLKTSLNNPSLIPLTPNIEIIDYPVVEKCNNAVIYWKSRLGGWMFWVFELVKKNNTHSYTGDLTVGMFDSTKTVGGQPFIPVNYTGITTGYSIELKSLSLTSQELKAVSGIHSTTAVYYTDDISGRLELMRLDSATVPLDNMASGGDFSVSLTNISTTTQKTM